MVERSLSMREVRGSIPRTSNTFLLLFALQAVFGLAVVVGWLFAPVLGWLGCWGVAPGCSFLVVWVACVFAGVGGSCLAVC